MVRTVGGYVMWYLATPHEVAPGEQPDYEIRTTTSVDGISNWTPPQTFTTHQEGFFDVAIAYSGDGWIMVLARGTNLHGTTPFPAQGLWWMRAPQPSAGRQHWTQPARLLDTDRPDAPEWMARGVCDPAAIVDSNGTLTVFVTGTRRYRNWPSLIASQVRKGQRLPVPAPFYLSTAVLQFPAVDTRSDPHSTG